MKRRTLVLALITLLVVVAAAVVSRQRAPQAGKEKALLFPGLAARINDIDTLSVEDGRAALTMRRRDGRWLILEADDYPALPDKVKQAVLAAADLRVIAEKTSDPARYQRLGVADPGSQGAVSHWLTLKHAEEELARLVVGDPRRSRSATAAPGLYVRVPGRAQALLATGRLNVSADVVQWIKRDVVNIAAERVRSVRLRPGANPAVHLEREAPTADLALQNIPAGKEPGAEYLINRLASILENVYVDGVRNESELDFSAPDSVVEVSAFGGLEARAEVKNSGERSYARFSFTAAPGNDAAMAVAPQPAGQEPAAAEQDATDAAMEDAAAEDSAMATDAATTDAATMEDAALATDAAMEDAAEESPTPAQEAESLNAATRGWAYRLPASKAELFAQTLDDLVRDPGKPDEE